MLLHPGDPPPFSIHNAAGISPLLLTCEHASHAIPSALADLGLPETERTRHIGWDIGAADATRRLAERLDAPAILANFSRLVVDLNRGPADATLIAPASDGTAVPANQSIGAEDRAARIDEIYVPYHAAVGRELDALIARHGGASRDPGPVVFITVHSFTPRLRVNGKDRPWPLGLLWARDDRAARRLKAWFDRERPALLRGQPVGMNEPYNLSDGSISPGVLGFHAEPRGVLCVEFELRQDEIETPAKANAWADLLAEAIRETLLPIAGRAPLAKR